MKVLLINGSPDPNSNTSAALSLLTEQFTQKGMTVHPFDLGAQPVGGCLSCGGCRESHRCVQPDHLCNPLIEAILAVDGVVVASPVYFGAPNGALCALLDRVFFSASTHGQLFRGKPAAALVSCDYVGGVPALERLHRYFLTSQMPVVGCYDFPVFRHRSLLRRDPAALALLENLGENLLTAMGGN